MNTNEDGLVKKCFATGKLVIWNHILSKTINIRASEKILSYLLDFIYLAIYSIYIYI